MDGQRIKRYWMQEIKENLLLLLVVGLLAGCARSTQEISRHPNGSVAKNEQRVHFGNGTVMRVTDVEGRELPKDIWREDFR